MNTGDTNTGVANSGDVNTGAFISGNYSNGVLWRGDYQGLLGFSSGANVLPVIPLSLDINGGVGAITIEPIHILPDIPININETLYLGPLVVPPINVPAISLGVGIPNISIGPIKINPITLWPAQNFNQTITLAWPVSSITIPQIQQVALSPSPIPTTLIGPIHINTGFSIPVTFSYSTPALTLFPVGLSIPTGGPLTLTLGVTAGTEAFTIPGFSIPEQPLPLAINVIGHINALSTPAITIDNIPLNLHAIGGVGPVDIVGGNVPASPGFGNSTTAPSSGFFNTGAGGVSGFGNVGAHTSGWFNQSTQAMQVLPGTVSGYFNSGTLMSGIGNVGTQLSGMLSGGALGGNNFGLGNIGFDNVGFGNAGSSNFGLANMGIGNIGLANTGNGNIGIGLSGDNLTGFGGFNSGSENVGLFNSGTGNVGFFNSGTGNLGVFNSGSHNTGFFLTGNNINVLAPFTPGTLFTISEIPIDLQVIGGIGPIHVQPIDIPAFDIQITGGFIGIREFTLPEITIPAIPIHVTGTVGLEGFHVNPAFVLFGQTAMAEITANPVVLPDPFITIDHYGPPLGPPGAKFPSGSFYLSISDLQINGPIIGSYGGPGTIPGPFGATFNLSTSSLALFPAGLTVPDQTPVTVNLTGGLDSITLFPGGLAFPENPVVSLTNFSVGTGGFTVFPQGFTVDRIPVDLHTTLSIGPFPFRWDYIPPTPANGPIPAVPGGFGLTSGLFPFHFTLNGGIGPISIPTTTVVDALNPLLTVTGNLEVGPFTVPDIPIPAINFGLDGNVNVSFNAPATTLLSGLGITGSIDISGIQITNIQTQPAQLFMSVGQTLFLFDFRDGIELNPIVIPGSSIPITMAGLSIPLPTVSESIPLNFSFGSPASTVKSMILHEILPIDVSINLEDAVFIPATVLPAIPLNVDVTIPVGPINIPIITEPGSGNSTTTTSDPFSGLAVPGLGVGLLGLFDGSIANNLISGFNSAVGIVGPNVGLSNLGGGNVGLGNVGDFNLGAGNVGGFNVGGGNIGGNNVPRRPPRPRRLPNPARRAPPLPPATPAVGTSAAVAAVAVQQPPGPAVLPRPAVGAITDQWTPQQRLGGPIDQIEQPLVGALRRRDVGGLGSRIRPAAASQRLHKLGMKRRRLGANRLIRLPVRAKQRRDRRRHLIGTRGQQRRRRGQRRGVGLRQRRPNARQIRSDRDQRLRRSNHKRHRLPPINHASAMSSGCTDRIADAPTINPVSHGQNAHHPAGGICTLHDAKHAPQQMALRRASGCRTCRQHLVVTMADRVRAADRRAAPTPKAWRYHRLHPMFKQACAICMGRSSERFAPRSKLLRRDGPCRAAGWVSTWSLVDFRRERIDPQTHTVAPGLQAGPDAREVPRVGDRLHGGGVVDETHHVEAPDLDRLGRDIGHRVVHAVAAIPHHEVLALDGGVAHRGADRLNGALVVEPDHDLLLVDPGRLGCGIQADVVGGVPYPGRRVVVVDAGRRRQNLAHLSRQVGAHRRGGPSARPRRSRGNSAGRRWLGQHRSSR